MKGARAMSLTPSARKVLTARLREHSAADLATMVEWLTGCRCKATNCHACNYMQPGGYTNPDTYLRPEKCAKYIDLAAQAAAKVDAPEAKPAAHDPAHEAQRALAIVRAACASRYDRSELRGDDPKQTQTMKYAIKALGGREWIADNLKAAADAWPTAWAAACEHMARKLEATR